jgi:hypothetical protein
MAIIYGNTPDRTYRINNHLNRNSLYLDKTIYIIEVFTPY